jgi:hypothetical protein
MATYVMESKDASLMYVRENRVVRFGRDQLHAFDANELGAHGSAQVSPTDRAG